MATVRKRSIAILFVVILAMMIAPATVSAQLNCDTGRPSLTGTWVIGKYLNASSGVRFRALKASLDLQYPPARYVPGAWTYSYLRLQGANGGFATIGVDYRDTGIYIYWQLANEQNQITRSGSLWDIYSSVPYTLQVKADANRFATALDVAWWVDGVLVDSVGTNEFYDNWVPTKSQIWTATGNWKNQVPGGTANTVNFTNATYYSEYGPNFEYQTSHSYGGYVRNDFGTGEAGLVTVSGYHFYQWDKSCPN